MNTKTCERCWWYFEIELGMGKCERVSTKKFFMYRDDYCSKWLTKELNMGKSPSFGFKTEDFTNGSVDNIENKIASIIKTNYNIARVRELRLLEILEYYAEGGDVGPGSLVLPPRDIKLRRFAVSLIHAITSGSNMKIITKLEEK